MLRLLFDENLAARLVQLLSDVYSDSAHVETLGLLGVPDRTIWATAGANAFVLVTKDEDFHRMSVLFGPPPKVIWVGSATARRRTWRSYFEISPRLYKRSLSMRTRPFWCWGNEARWLL